MSGKWQAPEGFTLTRHESYVLNAKGFLAAEGDAPMPDGQIHAAHFDENEPFTSDNSPNVQLLPIKGGVVPAQYTLVHEDDESAGAVAPHEGSVA